MARLAPRSLGYIAVLTLGLAVGLASGRFFAPLEAQSGGASALAAPRDLDGPADPNEVIYDQLSRQYEQFRQVDRTFELVSRAVSPAVVHIVARKELIEEDGHTSAFEETGSGVIVRADKSDVRYVLTNNHVVEGARAEDVTIHLHDGRVLKPELFWADFKVDVAVLKLDRTDLPVARLGDSDQAAIGSWVLAIGSPFGLTHSVSQGIISARSRYEAELEDDGVENQDFLQTDAAINPGNSGGPLVNLKGEVIGINTAIASNGGGSEGVGFSIPINLARWAMSQLVESGHVSRGAIGVRLIELDPETAVGLGLDRLRGARIEVVQSGSPAEEAGLKVGDVILRFNGQEVVDFNHLINLVSMSAIGQPADLVVWRERRPVNIQIVVADRNRVVAQSTPGAAPAFPTGGAARRPGLPMDVEPGPDEPSNLTTGLDLLSIDGVSMARRYGLGDTMRGVLVARLDVLCPLATHLRPSDLIESIDGRSVRTPEEVRLALAGTRDRGTVEITVVRALGGSLERRTIRVP